MIDINCQLENLQPVFVSFELEIPRVYKAFANIGHESILYLHMGCLNT